MAASRRGGQAMSSLFKVQTTVACTQCAKTRTPFLPAAILPPQHRTYSAEATASSPQQKSSTPAAAPPPATAPDYRIRAGLLLSRPPLLMRDPTPFEAAFYLYQKRLNERLTTSFRRNVYFKPDTTLALDWRLQMRDRKGTPARDIGHYRGGKGGNGFGGATAWDDEYTLNDPEANMLTNPDSLRERIVSDADLRVSDDGERLADADRIRVERPQKRTTAADETNDTQRLDRKLDRTLYLVVKAADGTWSFPTADVQTNENLHETAARALESAAGVDMNTWIVGRVPVAHIVRETTTTAEAAFTSEKTFLIKGRILAGQANLENNTLGVDAFQWLTKEELASHLPKYYYAGVKNAIPQR
ncbi:50S ribosomal subunit L30 [Sporothrix schenckii 1099-18]|uniref:Large ribosomal subunit protein mL46 n=2 Tax=Sporothrix schenckii TaxID=29908 RepID=U7Q4C5_SPOS1|nr:50S ribosomal subunit L30 [Sporothrix schenckii 1099-18]ERT02012.1 hypothetical protein HMPREF1624_00307 [Sporothrix schenckii ATCC 58251]KJR80807.1 50S ribosomal subunit L30 [Sporothrix schenckii 1099-18]